VADDSIGQRQAWCHHGGAAALRCARPNAIRRASWSHERRACGVEAPQREVLEFERAKEILNEAAAFSAQAELDRRAKGSALHRSAPNTYGVEPICAIVPIAPSTYFQRKAQQQDASSGCGRGATTSCAPRFSGSGTSTSRSTRRGRNGDRCGARSRGHGLYRRTNVPAALASATYDANNQITTWGGTSFTYDANGSLTSDGTRTYSWNARNQLAGISGGATASFQYDGTGRRRSKTVAAATKAFLYDGLNPVQEQGGTTTNLLTGLRIDEYLTRSPASSSEQFATDALGSTVALGDATGAVQTAYTYEPFGAAAQTGTATSNTFAFTGREADGTGLAYYRARYYDPRLQRFISEDPLQFGAGDPNFHAYVGNSPTDAVDPSGLIKISCSSRKILGWNPCSPFLAALAVGGLGAGPAIGAAASAAASGASSGVSASAASAAAARQTPPREVGLD